MLVIDWLSIDLYYSYDQKDKKKTITTFTLNDLCYLFSFLFSISDFGLKSHTNVSRRSFNWTERNLNEENENKTDRIQLYEARAHDENDRTSNAYTEQTNNDEPAKDSNRMRNNNQRNNVLNSKPNWIHTPNPMRSIETRETKHTDRGRERERKIFISIECARLCIDGRE